jgi:beta-RFAP synthase
VTLQVVARARLHFGFLEPGGGRDRRFGGMGLAIESPRAVLRFEPAPALVVEGPDADRVEILAARCLDRLEVPAGAHIRVVESVPAHVGLGSGSQLSLAVAAGLARLHGVDLPVGELCSLMGRARRSGVGFHLFERGGFVVEGGHPEAAHHAFRTPPLLFRHEFPEAWRVLLAIPEASRKVSGEAEEEAFRRLAPPPAPEVDGIARLVLMRLLPALVERDLAAFGAALAAVQERVGACFATIQEGPFHPAGARLARRLKDAGALGVGQSSWGPAVYAIAGNDAEERRLLALMRDTDPAAAVLATRGWNTGAALTAS